MNDPEIMNKRTFIKQLSLISTGMLFYSCNNYRKILGENRKISQADSNMWNEIFYYASLAPSGHNAQPWLVDLKNNNQFTIKIRKESLLPAVDPEMRETFLSIGAFLENLILSAQAFGLDVDYQVIADTTHDFDVVEGKFYKVANSSSFLDNLTARRTIRSNFLNKSILSNDLEKCLPSQLNATYYSLESNKSRLLKDMTYEANVCQVNRPETQIELAKWIHWSNKEVESHLDGLNTKSLGIKGVSEFYVRNFYTERSVLSETFKKQSLKIVKDQINNNGGWIIVTSASEKPEDLIHTGRLFENFFIKTRKNGIAIHPMTQILEEHPFKDEIGSSLGVKDKIQFLLRVGYLGSDFPSPVSLRRPVSSFLTRSI